METKNNEETKAFLKSLSLIIVGFLIIGILSFAVKVVFFPVNTVQKSIKMTYDVNNKTLTADNAITTYEWFKQQEEDIAALNKKEVRAKKTVEDYKKLNGDAKDWSFATTDEYNRLNSIATGMGNQLDDAMADYNAKSKMANKAIFKDNLPSNITRAFYTGMELIN